MHSKTFLGTAGEVLAESRLGEREVHAGMLASCGKKGLSQGYRLGDLERLFDIIPGGQNELRTSF